MRIKPIIAALSTALLALAAAAPASAKTEDLGSLTDGSAGFSNGFLRPVSNFTDYYTFSLTQSRDVLGQLVLIDIGQLFNINIFSVALSGTGIQGWLTDTVAADGFSFASVSAGNYTLAINGNVTGIWGGAYGGVIAGAVPEPETYAMMLLGLGAVGWAARRRKQQQQPKR